MNSIINEKYTLESLCARNKYKKITLPDVSKANQYVNLIESTRSETIPKAGDRIRLTTKYGDYYHMAHIEKMRDIGFLVCERPSVPCISQSDEGLSFFTGGGGAWPTIIPEKLVHVGKERKPFCCKANVGNETFEFEAEVSVWEYKEPGALYSDFTTKNWRRIHVTIQQEKEAQEGGYEFYGNGFAWRNRQEFDDFIKKFKGTTFPGNAENKLVVWCYSEEREYISEEEWKKLDLPIGTEHIGGKRVAKFRVDNQTNTVYHYFIDEKKTVNKMTLEYNELLKEVRNKIIKALSNTPENLIILDEQEQSDPVYMYYTDDDGCHYEGMVSTVGYDGEQLLLWLYDIDFSAEVGEKEYFYGFRSFDLLTCLLEHICELLDLDIDLL